MKPRARDLDIRIGQLQPGPLNAITDVPGVRVGHSNVRGQSASGRDICTGVTLIEPRAGSTNAQPCFAGVHVLNGNGDATGLEWIREAGLLTSPVAFTNTHSLGVVRDALIELDRAQQPDDGRLYWNMPVVLETFDGLLNDINGFHVKPEHVAEAMSNAVDGPVQEGAVGGGSGMICHEFKGGIGTASRRLSKAQGGWTVGAIVQANHGIRSELRVDGYPVGRYMEQVDSPFLRASLPHPGMGSIVVCLATDAPLLPHQCTRLAQRASLGLARTGVATKITAVTFSLPSPPATNRSRPLLTRAKARPPATACGWSTTTTSASCFWRRPRRLKRRSSTPCWPATAPKATGTRCRGWMLRPCSPPSKKQAGPALAETVPKDH